MPEQAHSNRLQSGAMMVEMAVVFPLLLLIGAVIVQVALLYHFKQGLALAGLQASRAASLQHGDYAAQRQAISKALVPWFGGGNSLLELQQSLGRSSLDVAAYARLEVINPTEQDFQIFSDPYLSALEGRLVIAQGDLWRKAGFKAAGAEKTKLESLRYRVRLEYAAPANVPVAGKLMVFLMSLASESPQPDSGQNSRSGVGAAQSDSADSGGSGGTEGGGSGGSGGSGSFRDWALARGRIPLVTEYETIMQSDLYQPDGFVSEPGVETFAGFEAVDASACAGAACAGDWDGSILGGSGFSIPSEPGPQDLGGGLEDADPPPCNHPFCGAGGNDTCASSAVE